MEPGDHRARLVVESGGRVGSVTVDFLARSADGREWAHGPATAMALEPGTPTRLLSIPLADAPAGENELVFTVRDEVSGRTLEAREPFRVDGGHEWPLSSPPA